MESEATISPILAISAISLVFVMFAMLVAMDFGAGAPVRALVRSHGQTMMAIVAGSSMAASLYYSDVVGFVPCEMCWFQRIAMYPLAILLTVAAVSRTKLDARFLVTLATLGFIVSVYHYQLQLFPNQAPICSGPVSCAGKNVDQFGFVTIPFMAGCGFLSIILLQVARWRAEYLARGFDDSTSPANAVGNYA